MKVEHEVVVGTEGDRDTKSTEASLCKYRRMHMFGCAVGAGGRHRARAGPQNPPCQPKLKKFDRETASMDLPGRRPWRVRR